MKFADKISKLSLKGLKFNAGRRKLANLGLNYAGRTKTGRHIFKDAQGRIRAAYDPVSQKGGGHWHKWSYKNGKRYSLNDSGGVVDKSATAAHIPIR